jgi:histidine ammonia-lyase
VLGIELMCAAQAVDLRAPVTSSAALMAAHRLVRREIPYAPVDRAFGRDLEKAIGIVQGDALLNAAADHVVVV